MALPEKIGGPKEDKKPGLVVAIGVKPKGLPPRIGGPKEDGDGGDSMSNREAKREAAREVMKAIKDGSDMALEDALTAFFYACDAEPHEEGEHENEEPTEETEEET